MTGDNVGNAAASENDNPQSAAAPAEAADTPSTFDPENPSGIRIRMPDIRRALMCGRGPQGWFRLRNLDYDKFVLEGYPIETLEAIDDEMSRQVCEKAREFYGIPKE